jgi:hypothetical protein
MSWKTQEHWTTSYIITINDALHDVRLWLPEFWLLYFEISNSVLNSRWCFTWKTRFWSEVRYVNNTDLQKCSAQGTPERPPCSRLVTWFWSKIKEICNKVCHWSSGVLRHLGRQQRRFPTLWKYTFKVFWLKNKAIKQFHKTSHKI